MQSRRFIQARGLVGVRGSRRIPAESTRRYFQFQSRFQSSIIRHPRASTFPNVVRLKQQRWHVGPLSIPSWTNPPAFPGVQFLGRTSNKVPRTILLASFVNTISPEGLERIRKHILCAHTHTQAHLGHYWWCPVCDLDSLPPLAIIL